MAHLQSVRRSGDGRSMAQRLNLSGTAYPSGWTPKLILLESLPATVERQSPMEAEIFGCRARDRADGGALLLMFPTALEC